MAWHREQQLQQCYRESVAMWQKYTRRASAPAKPSLVEAFGSHILGWMALAALCGVIAGMVIRLGWGWEVLSLLGLAGLLCGVLACFTRRAVRQFHRRLREYREAQEDLEAYLRQHVKPMESLEDHRARVRGTRTCRAGEKP